MHVRVSVRSWNSAARSLAIDAMCCGAVASIALMVGNSPLMRAGLLPPAFAPTGPLPLVTVALLEAAALASMLFRARTIAGAFRSARRRGADFFDAVEVGVIALGPAATPLARWLRLELEVWFSACSAGVCA